MRDHTMNPDPGLRLTAERLLSTARNAHRDLRFGERKVYLCAIVDITDTAVLAILDDCRRAQLLTFARADLVAAMDPELVDASEWHLDGATYHFLVVS
jgi:hypothetical protein